MKKSSVPYYDERFTGRHRNKMQHIMHIAVQSRLALIVHPRHFVIHLPHSRSFAAEHAEELLGVGHEFIMEEYYQEAASEIEIGQFTPVTSFSHLCLPASNMLGPATAAASGVAVEEKTNNTLFKLPEFVDYREEVVGEYWDCYS